MTKKCYVCGKDFSAKYKCRLKNKLTCSRECSNIYGSFLKKGPKNPNWRGGLITNKCAVCGKLFKVKISRKDSKYCSDKCKGASYRIIDRKDGVKGFCRGVVNNYIRTNRLIPKPCEICGREGFTKNNKNIVHAHHNDYNKPLDVQWLCARCHRRLHAKLNALLNSEKAVSEAE